MGSRSGQRTVLVTGAGSGIGRAVAVRVAADGNRVAAVDRDANGLRQTMDLLSGDGHVSSVVDVTDLASLKAAVEHQADDARPLRGVVAVAGIEVLGDVLELEPSEW